MAQGHLTRDVKYPVVQSKIGKQSLVRFQGLPWRSTSGVTEEKLQTFPKLPVRENDIFIASYPRSGSTWTQEIVWQVVKDGEIDSRPLEIRVPFLEGMVLGPPHPYQAQDPDSMVNIFDSFQKPRVFKTHLTYELVPKGNEEAIKQRYIYVMRNPKDTAVSYFHHYCNMPFICTPYSWNGWFEDFITGNVGYGEWCDHVLNWWKQRDNPDILFQKYEDRMKNPAACISEIAKFIGKDLTSETLDRIVQQTSFNAMQKSDNVNRSWMKGVKKDGFIRKGRVGEWQQYFTEEQNALFDKLYEEKIEGTGLSFTWE